jgi:uncharacterized protein YegP (UPF0339 family)
MRIYVFEREDGDFGVRLVGGNGEVVMSSEGYASKGNANRAADRLAEVIRSDEEVRVFRASESEGS